MKKKLNVLYQTNNAYAAITGVSIYSLLKNNIDIDELTIYIIDDGIDKENIKRMKKVCKDFKRKIVFIDSKKYIDEIKKCNLRSYRNGYTTYLKLFGFKYIKTNNDMILLLDGDTIIDGSLSDICEIDMSNNAIAAVCDTIYNGYKKMIGMKKDDRYYNGGVLLVNQKLYRDNKYLERIIDHWVNTTNQYYLADQDIINVLFSKEIKYLDIKYNFISGFYIFGIDNTFSIYKLKESFFHKKSIIEDRMKKPIVHHCMGAITGRPWQIDNTHPLNDLFDKYLYESPWKDFKKVPQNSGKIIEIQKTLHKVLPSVLYNPIHSISQYLFLKKNNGKIRK